MVMRNYSPFSISEIVMAILTIAVWQQTTGQAYLLPPSYPAMNFPMLRLPGGPPLALVKLLVKMRSPELSNPLSGPINEERNHLKYHNIERKSRRSNRIFDSYKKLGAHKFAENSPEWNLAMIQFLLEMKKNGQKIREIKTFKSMPELHKELSGSGRTFNIGDQQLNGGFNEKDEFQGGEESDSLEDGSKQDPIICKMEPFNICYRMDASGIMHPLGDRRPVRLLRVYKKK